MQRRTFLKLIPALVAGFKSATIKYAPKLAEKCGFYGMLEEGRVCIDRRVIAGIKWPPYVSSVCNSTYVATGQMMRGMICNDKPELPAGIICDEKIEWYDMNKV